MTESFHTFLPLVARTVAAGLFLIAVAIVGNLTAQKTDWAWPGVFFLIVLLWLLAVDWEKIL